MGELAFIAPSTANRGDEFVIPVDSCTLPIPDHKTKQKYTHKKLVRRRKVATLPGHGGFKYPLFWAGPESVALVTEDPGALLF